MNEWQERHGKELIPKQRKVRYPCKECSKIQDRENIRDGEKLSITTRQLSKQEERTRILCLLSFMMVLFLGCMPGSSAGRKAEMRPIYLIPVGKIEQDLLAHLSSLIEEIFPFSVKVDEALPHPDYAYNQRRGQHKSDLILGRLQKLDLEEAEKILGAVDLDLYTPGLNFVFGQASIGGRVALIALPRLRQEFYGLPEDEKLYYSRALKEAVHELGHTFGLGHCKKRECVMYFSNSLADTDYKGKEFCEDCLNKLFFKESER